MTGATPREQAALERIAERNRQGGEERRASMPELDVDAWCSAVASAAGGFSQSTFNGCIADEQEAYDDMKSSYMRVPENIREWCEKVANAAAGGSFDTLHGCIMQEAEAVLESPTFQP